jgi:uncharacterized SAM-binding protein YcdF (DUF218 family)
MQILRAIDRFLEPSALLAFFILASMGAIIARRWRLATLLQAVAAAIVVLIGILPGAAWLALPLERRFPADPVLPSQIAGIIAIGGTERPRQSATWGQPILDDPTPIAALVALGRRYPDAKLVFAGGAHPRDAKDVTEAQIVRQFLAMMGVGSDRVVYEDRSRNTLENALFARALVHPQAEPWILVTQAISLPRAVAVFRHAGWTVIPYPAGYLTADDAHLSAGTDLAGDLRLASLALHEWGGILVYRLMGYTGELFPR